MEILGVGGIEIENAISTLNVSSSDSQVSDVMRMFLHLPQKHQDFYLGKIVRITNKKKQDIKLILDGIKIKEGDVCGVDIPDIAMQTFLDTKYANGTHFIRYSDGRYYQYNLRNWEYISDPLVKKYLADYVRDVLTEYEQGGLSSSLNASLNILEGHATPNNDPFSLNNKDIKPVINCKNCEVWFDRNGVFTTNPHRAESYLRYCLDVEYDESAKSPMFDKAVLEIFSASSDPEDMFRHFMEFAGYLTPVSLKENFCF